MKEMISYCGLNCFDCPAYKATQADDDGERKKVVKLFSKLFNLEFKVSDINCDGCLAHDGKLFGHCTNCAVRSCGMEKGVENCGHCSDYSCDKLDAQLDNIPMAEPRNRLEAIRKSL